MDRITDQLINKLNEGWKVKICALINNSINNNNYEQDIPVKIIAIPKSKSNLVKDFRPIALIPIMTKITNSYIKNLLTEHCNENNIIPPNSFAYQVGKNTVLVGEEVINTLIINKNNKKNSAVIYLDFSGAYNTVNHKRLIDILNEHNFPNPIIKWISKVLKSTILTMKCKDGEIRRKLRSGVLQGSVISPSQAG